MLKNNNEEKTMFNRLNNTTDYAGKAKSFRFQRGYGSIGFTNNEPTQHTATLYGGFYDWDTAKTFREVKVLVLDTTATTGKIEKNDDITTYTIPATKEQVDEALEMASNHDVYFERPEMTIYSKGVKNITQTYTYMASCGE